MGLFGIILDKNEKKNTSQIENLAPFQSLKRCSCVYKRCNHDLHTNGRNIIFIQVRQDDNLSKLLKRSHYL